MSKQNLQTLKSQRNLEAWAERVRARRLNIPGLGHRDFRFTGTFDVLIAGLTMSKPQNTHSVLWCEDYAGA